MWVVFAVPTALLSCDMFYLTLTSDDYVSHAHDFAELLWITANLVWACSEVFYPDGEDVPVYLTSELRTSNLRWVATWLVVSAFFPLVVMYLIWIKDTLVMKKEALFSSRLALSEVDADNSQGQVRTTELVPVSSHDTNVTI